MILGITGGIGSGKTTACGVFNVLGIPAFLTDIEAKNLMESDTALREGINSVVGADIYPGGKLDRAGLAEKIFNNRSMLQNINNLVHPLVLENFKIWTTLQHAPYVIMESAILFESGGASLVDRVASLIAPVEERIERVLYRSGMSKSQILERIDNQITDEKRIELSDYIIPNAERDMIIPVILNIHHDIMSCIKPEEGNG